MKIWSATASNFYNEIMGGLANFFSLDANETTEAELHQKLTEAGTLEQIKANAVKDANDAVAAQMADFNAKLESLQTQFEALQSDAQSKGEKVAALETELETVRGEITAKEAEIARNLEQIKGLSGEVATLKAGKPIEKHAPADDTKPIPGATRTGGARQVSMEELMAAAKAK